MGVPTESMNCRLSSHRDFIRAVATPAEVYVHGRHSVERQIAATETIRSGTIAERYGHTAQ